MKTFAEIVAVGSELTCGSRLDTNSQWLSRELESLGWTVQLHTSVADDQALIANCLRAAMTRSRVVIVTGGLGPTLDDVSRESLSEAMDSPLETDEQALDAIRSLFASRGRVMAPRNERQALRPEGAETLPNRCGSAPGIWAEAENGESQNHWCMALLPGVPAEMKQMFHEQVVPRLPASGIECHRKVLRTFGFGESDAEQLLGDLTERGRNPEVGITAGGAVISLWLTGRATDADAARGLVEEAEAKIHDRLGTAIYGEGEIDLQTVVGRMAASRTFRVALLEGSTTGGRMMDWLSGHPDWENLVADARLIPDTRGAARGWSEEAEGLAQQLLASGQVDGVLMSSASYDHREESGIVVRKGAVGLRTVDNLWRGRADMAGNLAIFRDRAARMAINRLRLHFLEN